MQVCKHVFKTLLSILLSIDPNVKLGHTSFVFISLSTVFSGHGGKGLGFEVIALAFKSPCQPSTGYVTSGMFPNISKTCTFPLQNENIMPTVLVS